MAKTESGLEENIAAALSYVLGFITGIIFLLIEKDNKFVKFHALQSIAFSVAAMIISWVLTITIILVILVPILWIIWTILWILLMYKAYKGEKWKLPIIGDFAEKNSK